jgi:hypothetical protein
MVRRLSRRARSSGVEHLTFNQRVDGSIPSGLTKKIKNSTMKAGRLRAILCTRIAKNPKVLRNL